MSRSFGLSEAVENYVRSANREEHPVLKRCREETARELAGPSRMQISPEQGAFLNVLARLTGARDAIEVGVFTGYSAIATALAMRDRHRSEARLVACDQSAEYMARAVLYFEAAGIADIIEPRIGPAIESLDHLIENGEVGQFDFAFIDADKTGYPNYYERMVTLLRPGGVMAFDNMLWGGDVADAANTEADTKALRDTAARARDDDRVEVAFTTVGDGVLVCIRR